jgi:hypothetical protein
VLTEAHGIPVGLVVDGANRHDMKLAQATVDSIPIERPAPTSEQPQGLCLDKGYDFDEVRQTMQEFGFTLHIRSRGGKRPRQSNGKPASKLDVGWWNVLTAG